MIMSDSRCDLCGEQPPTFLCFCVEARVCRGCISAHLLASPSTLHKPVPLDSLDLIEMLRAETKPVVEKEEVIEEPSSSAPERLLLLGELERLDAFQTKALSELQTLRQALEQQVAVVIEELTQSVRSQTQGLQTLLQQRLSGLDSSSVSEGSLPEQLLTLSLAVSEVDVGSVVKGCFGLVMERKAVAQRPESTILYKIFGGSNSVGVFEAASETLEHTLNAPLRFFHNCCSCEGPTGDVYITGGSLTGRSRNDLMVFSPTTSQARELKAMQISRRSHASLFAGQILYVFGGLLDEERISLCERYLPETDTWQNIAQMQERRAYLAACEFKDKVYIGGGAERSSCEVYDPTHDNFVLVEAPHSAIQDNCCMMTLPDSILIFHGNFRGDVTRFTPVTGKFVREKEMCVGNSWSSCPPVCVRGTIYMLRSDSIFKYQVETGASEYVLRMAKVAKRRVRLDS